MTSKTQDKAIKQLRPGQTPAACTEALATGPISLDLVLNLLSRAGEQPAVVDYQPPDHLPKLRLLPQADCRRYDRLLVGGGHAS